MGYFCEILSGHTQNYGNYWLNCIFLLQQNLHMHCNLKESTDRYKKYPNNKII